MEGMMVKKLNIRITPAGSKEGCKNTVKGV